MPAKKAKKKKSGKIRKPSKAKKKTEDSPKTSKNRINLPKYLNLVKENGYVYLKYETDREDLAVILRMQIKGNDILFSTMEYNVNFVELFTLFMDVVQANLMDTMQAAKNLDMEFLAIDDPYLSTKKYDIMIGRFKNDKVLVHDFKFNWAYRFIDENGDICMYFKSPQFFEDLRKISNEIPKKEIKYQKPKESDFKTEHQIPPYLHFFPFRVKLEKKIASFDNPQIMYSLAIPLLMCKTFGQLPSLKVFEYTNNFSQNAETGEVGHTNFALNALTGVLVKSRKNPKKGFGITGMLNITSEGSFLTLEIFNMAFEKVICGETIKFKEQDIIKVIYGTIDFIVHKCGLEHLMVRKMLIHESLKKNPKAFLAYLQIAGIMELRPTIQSLLKQNKPVLGKEIFSEKRIVEVFAEGFESQPDFLVLQLMWMDFLTGMPDAEKIRLRKDIIKVDSMIQNKREDYVNFFNSMKLKKKGFMGLFRK